MRTRFAGIALALLTPFAALATAAPAPGDTRAAVEASLGSPTILRRLDDGAVLAKYPRGTVTYRDGRVVALVLMPEKEWLARAEADRKAAAETEARKLADRAALTELLASASFRQLSLAGRVAALDALRTRHPAAETDTLRADLLARIERKNATESRVLALEKELADTRRQLEALRDAPPPAPVIIEKTRVVEVPAEPQVVYVPGVVRDPSVTTFHSPRHRHGDKPRRDPLNNTPPVGTPGQIFPYNPTAQHIISGPKAASPIIPYNPINQYTIGANPAPPAPKPAAPTTPDGKKDDAKQKTKR